MNLLRRTKTDTVANRQPRQHRHHHDDNAVDHEKKSQNNNKLRRTKTTEPSAVVSPRKDKPTRTKSNEEVAMRIRRTKTDATPTTKHHHTKKDRRMTDIQAMKQMKSSRQTSQGVAAGVMAGAMREMDPQSIIDMLEAYAGDDDDRDMAANCLENLKKFGQGDCGEPVAMTSPRKSGSEVRHSRSKRTSKDGKLRNSTGSTTSTASSSTGRPSLGEVKGDWASVSISELLGE